MSQRPDDNLQEFFPGSRNDQTLTDTQNLLQELYRCQEQIAALQDFFDNANVGLHWVGADGIILRANHAELQMLGYTTEEYIGHPIQEFHADPPVIEDILTRLIRGEKLTDYEARLRCKNGSIRIVQIHSSVYREHGQFIHTRCFTRDVTQQKETAAELAKADQVAQQLAAIVASSDDAIISKDLDGTIQSWNPGAERIFGYTAEEIIGRSLTILVPADRINEESKILEKLRSGQPIDHFETVRIRKDGLLIDVSVTISPLRDSTGQIIGASKVARDITANKQALAKVIASESLKSAILNNSLDGIITMDHHGQILDFNPAAESMFGYLKSEVLQQNLASLIVPAAYRTAHAEGLKQYLKTGQGPVIGKRFEITALHRHGTEFPIELTVTAIPHHTSPVFTASLRDLTETHKNAIALDERIRLLALGGDIGVAWAQTGSLASILQQCSEAIIQHLDGAFARIWTLDDSGDMLTLVASAGMYTHRDGPHGRIQVGQYKIGMIALERKPHLTNFVVGDPRVSNQPWAIREGMVAFVGYPLIVEEKLMGVVAMFARHTLSQTTMAALGSAADTIALGISRKRTEEALIRSEQLAREANRAKSEFLANMSHEIRTPMNGILGMTRLALNSNLTAVQREYLETVHRSAESLLGIINDILDFSKIEANKLRLDATSFSLLQCIENAVQDSIPSTQAKPVELTFEVDPEIPQAIVGDAGRLRQILLNLLSNAIKFTERGEISLRVKQVDRSAEAIWLEFAVQDTGIGIPIDQQTGIFGAFEQADSSISRLYGGTGLGLSISAKLVAMMGGELTVESQIGVGSTFSFRARFAPSNLATPARSLQALVALRGLRVLVVDDNATNRRILSEQLTNWNMTPHCVTNGYDAVQAIHEAESAGRPFSLVLLDALMPGMDGYAVATTLQKNSTAHRQTPATIMMLSSMDFSVNSDRLQSLGIQSCLTKPVRPSLLLNTILEFVNRDLERPHAEALTRDIPARERPSKQEPAASASVATTKSLQILLAEDNLINQKVAAATLASLGYQVFIANNGYEALQALETQTFDLVLMDVQMPRMDGLEATKEIRKREQLSGGHIPIVALTAHAMKEDRERCLAAGMDEYASKPIQPAELDQIIHRSLPLATPNTTTPSIATPSITNDRETIDLNLLRERVGGDMSLMNEILSISKSEFSRLLIEMETAIQQQDSQRIQDTAHTLKGALGNLTAMRAADVALTLETRGRDQNLSGIEADFIKLNDHLHQLLETFKNIQSR